MEFGRNAMTRWEHVYREAYSGIHTGSLDPITTPQAL